MHTVSIIIPTYNSREYIVTTIASALNQKEVEVEVIVVDDGSIDGTKDVLETQQLLSQIKYVYQPNQGVSAARNQGLKLAKSEFCCFLDSDDLLDPTFCTKMISFLEQKKASIVYCNYNYFINDDIQAVIEKKFPSFSGEIFSKLLCGNFIPTDSVLFRRSILHNSIAFNTEFSTMEDWLFWLSLARNHPIFFLEETLCFIRVRGKSLTTNLKQLNEDSNKAYKFLSILYAEELALLDCKTKYSFYYNYAVCGLRIGNIGDALRIFLHHGIYRDVKLAVRFAIRFFYYNVFTKKISANCKCKLNTLVK